MKVLLFLLLFSTSFRKITGNVNTSGMKLIQNTKGVSYNKQFYTIQRQMNWKRAREFCTSRGMHLATIESPEEQELFSSLAQINEEFREKFQFLWLSGSDSEEEGGWRWVETGSRMEFTNWYTGQEEVPQSFDKNCLVMNLKWNGESVRWEDTYCQRTQAHPVCQTWVGGTNQNQRRPNNNNNNKGHEVSYDFTISYFDGAPDGVSKRVLGINNQFPGPTIRLKKNQILKVTVHNKIQDYQNTSIHWHGLEQRGTPWEDGPEGINQCPIVPGSSQVYRFKVSQAGTFWYHSHSSYQYTEGCWGALVVEDSPKDVYSHRYNGELVVTLNDWYHVPSRSLSEWYLSPYSQGHEPIPDSILINGRGTYPCDKAKVKGLNCDKMEQGPALFKVHGKRTYRIRVINASTMTSFYFAIDGHTLTPIEADGVTTVIAGEVGEVFLSAAQRYSFLVTMNGGLPQYWIRARAFTENFIKNPHYPQSLPDVFLTNPSGVAVLRYNVMPQRQKRELFCANNNSTRIKRQIQFQPQRNNNKGPPPDPVHVPTAKGKYPQTNAALTPVVLGPENQRSLRPYDNIQAPSYYDQLVTLNIISFDTKPTFNGIPYHTGNGNSLPVLHQMLRNDQINPNVNPIAIQAGKVIQVVVNNPREHGHPFHLHGHTFWVVGGGSNETYDERRDGNSLYLDGVKRDTTSMGGMSWMAIRFIADNPGVWLFHCHIHWHLEAGLGAVFIEGAAEARSTYKIPQSSANVCVRAGFDRRYFTNLLN